jgi:hypothetical protein
MASDRMKTRYDRLVNCTGYHEVARAWLCRSTRTKGKSLKHQSSWESPYSVVMRVDDVVYKIQRNPRSRMMMVHLHCLVPYQGTAWDERLWRGSSGINWGPATVRTDPRRKEGCKSPKSGVVSASARRWSTIRENEYTCQDTSPQKRRTDSTLVGYSGRIAWRKQQCGISVESQNYEASKDSCC